MKKMTKTAMQQANGGRWKCTKCGYKNPTYTQAVTHFWRYCDGAKGHAVMSTTEGYGKYIKWCL